MKKQRKNTLTVFLTLILCFTLQRTLVPGAIHNYPNNKIAMILLNSYEETLSIGEEYQLFAVLTTSQKVSFKSSNSKVASVNTYGLVTAKRDGKAKITAKIKNAEASCYITVRKTDLTLNTTKTSLECNGTCILQADTSTSTKVTYRSLKKSVADVDENGLITAKKPGEAIIKVTADTTIATCKVIVRKPTLTLSQSNLELFRTNSTKLYCNVSSKKTPQWKSNKKSVATVDQFGNVKAIKHGTAIIKAVVDGVEACCTVQVNQPSVIFDKTELTLNTGETEKLIATVSSNNIPIYKSSNDSIVTIDQGVITAHSKGTAYVYAIEDGIKARCKVKVLAPKK